MTRNRFRNKIMRGTYDGMVKAYREKGSLLFHKDGTPHRGNSWAGDFWNGFNGVNSVNWDQESKRRPFYATWCAGRDMAKEQE